LSKTPNKEASPAALLVESRTPKKSFVFLLEEKIRRASGTLSSETTNAMTENPIHFFQFMIFSFCVLIVRNLPSLSPRPYLITSS